MRRTGGGSFPQERRCPLTPCRSRSARTNFLATFPVVLSRGPTGPRFVCGAHCAPPLFALQIKTMQVIPPTATSQALLRDALIPAVRAAVAELQSTGEHFYYVVLITTGEGLAPILCAWSVEALQRAAVAAISSENVLDLKWSYADAPYFDVGRDAFEPVRALFARRPDMSAISEAEWDHEHELRLGAMEGALHAVNAEGLFGTGAAREKVLVNVEVVPPDAGNTRRAMRLNPSAALVSWLLEAAEPLTE